MLTLTYFLQSLLAKLGFVGEKRYLFSRIFISCGSETALRMRFAPSSKYNFAW